MFLVRKSFANVRCFINHIRTTDHGSGAYRESHDEVDIKAARAKQQICAVQEMAFGIRLSALGEG